MPPPPAVAIPPGLEALSSADARDRLARHGPNRWVARDRTARLRALVQPLLDPMALMLVVASGVYFVLGETRDAVVLAVALVPVLGVDVALEARARTALDRLARAASPLADVVRDGAIVSVPIETVVPGDLLALREGAVVAADATVRWAANLAVDESSLTGESEPQPKNDADAVFAGSVVRSGHGFASVHTTGADTRYGGIAALVTQTAAAASPLQRHAGALVRRLGVVALVIAAGLFAISLLRGEPWTEGLLGAVSLAMAAIPEEFPLVLTLFLSVGAWRLAEHGLLVRRLASVETLGSTTVICTDKTGTLTRGLPEVATHVALGDAMSERELLEAAVLACERHPTDAMEQAIALYAAARGVDPSGVDARWTLVRDYDFDSAGKHMSHVWRAADASAPGSASGNPAGAFVVAAKGAVEGVLAHCARDGDLRRQALRENDALASRGMRVLLVAGKRVAAPGADRRDDERDLVPYGLLGFQDPLRPEVPDAVRECQRAGIRIKMITGDHALTAHAIAEAAGIIHDDGLIVTGDEIARLEPVERADRIDKAAIFARVSPEQKFLIVDALEHDGAVVAMTGDGVNDAPALRRADIGIAMGQRGTDVARATADLVLLDDNFASIVETIHEGRHILDNVQRAFLYLIAFHVPIIALAVAVPLSGLPLLLLPIHLVWLELVVHPVSALVFQAEPPTADVMERPPRDPAAPLLPRRALMASSASGMLLALVVFALFWSQLGAFGEPRARALALVAMIAGYQTLVFAERVALHKGRVDVVPRGPVFWVVWWVVTMSLFVAIYVPDVADLFRVAAPPRDAVLFAAILGAAAVAWRLVRVRHVALACAIALTAACVRPRVVAVADARVTPVLWHEPGAAEDAVKPPRPPFRFVKEDFDGDSPKFTVTDAAGAHWKVKLGAEARTEVAAGRLLARAGYYVEPMYFAATARVDGIERLQRGREHLGADGTVRRLKFEPRSKEVTRGERWEWFANPFVGTPQLDGLRVLMVLMNNYDARAANNRVLLVRSGGGRREARYVVADLGASFGQYGGLGGTRTKSDLAGYRASPFIDRVSNGQVRFAYRTRPEGFGLTLFLLNPFYAAGELRKQREMDQAPLESVRWIARVLKTLDARGITAAFEDAGYPPAEADGFAAVVRARIDALGRL